MTIEQRSSEGDAMTKRKRTLRERAQDFGEAIYKDKNHPLRFERMNCPAVLLISGSLATAQAKRKERQRL